MAKKMIDLREALFDTLEKVRNDQISPEKAKQICDIAQILINSANAETTYIKTINSTKGSGFIELENIKQDGPMD